MSYRTEETLAEMMRRQAFEAVTIRDENIYKNAIDCIKHSVNNGNFSLFMCKYRDNNNSCYSHFDENIVKTLSRKLIQNGFKVVKGKSDSITISW